MRSASIKIAERTLYENYSLVFFVEITIDFDFISKHVRLVNVTQKSFYNLYIKIVAIIYNRIWQPSQVCRSIYITENGSCVNL